MTSRLEQYQPALASAQDETAERLFWSAHDFGQPPKQFALKEIFAPQFEQSASTDWLLARADTTFNRGEKNGLSNAVEKLDTARRDRFNSRIAEIEIRAGQEKLTASQVDATYAQVRRLLEGHSNSLTDEQLINIGEQVLSMSADPTSIDQGVHDCCGAAVVEVRTYMRHPELASKLVADVALSGQVMTGKGTVIDIDLTPHDTSKLAFPKSGQRSHASELFQVAAINLVLNDRPGALEGSIRYIQNDRRPEASDTGERVIDSSVFPPKERKFEGLYVADVLRMNKLITGEDEPDLVLWRARERGASRYGKTFTTEAEMEKALSDAKRDGKLPAILYVYSGSEPLWQDAPNNADGGRGSWHFINVTDILPGKPPKVEIDSTWSKRADHTKGSGKPISLSDLYLSTLDPNEAEAELRKRVDADSTSGKIDTGRQIALARQQWVNNNISTDGLEQSLRELLLYADFRWKNEAKAGKLDAGEKDRSLTKLMESVDRLPYANKIRMLESLKSKGVIDDGEYNSAVVATANEMSEQRMMITFAGEMTPQSEAAFRNAQDELGKRLRSMSPQVRTQVDEQLKRGQNTDNTGFFASRAKERRGRRKL